MSVLQRQELEGSPLADLHAIASEIGLEGYRGLRRDDLVAAILGEQGGEPAGEPEGADGPDAELDDAPRRGRRRSGRGRGRRGGAAGEGPEQGGADAEPAGEDAAEDAAEDAGAEPDEPAGEPVAGILDVLPNGSGFLRVADGDDVYVSPAQIRRCELRAGDEVSGPLRPARRNERHPSLVRVEAVNGRDAEPPEQRPLFDELGAAHASERLPGPDSLEDVAYGKGSRVAIAGAPGTGLTRTLAEMVDALRGVDGLSVSVVLAGARPEEVSGWRSVEGLDVSGGSFERSIDAQAQAAELAVERAKRVAERGGDAVVAIDSLEALPAGAARRVFGAARRLEEGGSLTVIAVVGGAHEPLRQANTVITLDAAASEPTVLAARSHVQRPDLLS